MILLVMEFCCCYVGLRLSERVRWGCNECVTSSVNTPSILIISCRNNNTNSNVKSLPRPQDGVAMSLKFYLLDFALFSDWKDRFRSKLNSLKNKDRFDSNQSTGNFKGKVNSKTYERDEGNCATFHCKLVLSLVKSFMIKWSQTLL